MKKLFVNGNFYTLVAENDQVEAIAVEDGIITQVGDRTDFDESAYEVVDLAGKTILPGFQDAHMHLTLLGNELFDCDLSGTTSIDKIVERMQTHIEEEAIPEGSWVIGKGWNQTFLEEGRMPNRHDADRISKKHNILLLRVCYHAGAVSTNVLEEVLTEEDFQVEGGSFEKDAKGNYNGIALERALQVIYAKLPALTTDRVKEYMKLAMDHLAAAGITRTNSDDFVLPNATPELIMASYNELIDEDDMKIRVNLQAMLPSVELFNQFYEQGYRAGWSRDKFKVSFLKLLLDGSLGSRTASLREDYSDDPGNRGILMFEYEELKALFAEATDKGFPIGIHVIGDRALEIVLDIVDELKETTNILENRLNLVHCQIVGNDLLARIIDNDLVVNAHPIFMNYDIHMAEDRVGKARLSESYNYRTMLDNHVKLAFGSDNPVEPVNPLYGIHCAVNRQDLNRYPEEGWYTDEAVTVYEAVHAFTRGSAYASFDEEYSGSLEVGKEADFVVLSEDLFAVAEEDILDVEVLATYVAGEAVYQVCNFKKLDSY